MKHSALTIGVMIAALSTAGLAQANPGHGNGHGHGHDKGHRHHDRDDHRHDHDRYDHNRYDHNRYDHDRYRDHHHDWREGGHIASRYYRDDRYWVRDWHSRHLPQPPHGHRWMHIDGDYVLAAVATGVITAIVLGH
ncbi:RcnB family protein [Salinicola halimionae]|uniref:RcnB family protein n=1 Tax=Salinicola halimionae TaxID=1949081 RepID=UPI000DA1159C|nr:RcnB family protein [Salinicola halimionae]